ncbi:MAG: hypothetical protein ABII90_13745 [Bacteroidota bacterium]
MREEAEVCNVYEIPENNPNSGKRESAPTEREDYKEDVEDFCFSVFLLQYFSFLTSDTGNTNLCDYHSTLLEIPTPPPEAAIL